MKRRMVFNLLLMAFFVTLVASATLFILAIWFNDTRLGGIGGITTVLTITFGIWAGMYYSFTDLKWEKN